MKVGYLDSVIQRIPIRLACKGYYLMWWYNGWHYWFYLSGEMLMNTEGQEYRTTGTRKIAMGSGQITLNQVRALRTILLTREVYLYTDVGWKNIRVDQGNIVTLKNQINGYEFEIITTVGSREISLTGYSPVKNIPEAIVYSGIVIIHHNDGVFTITITGDGVIIIDWGDGSPPETIILVDGVPQEITHDYTGTTGDHTITIEGEENIVAIEADGQDITEIYIPPTAVNLEELILPNNEIVDTPVIPDSVPLEVLDLDGNPLSICEVHIGTQVWMCKNYDSNYPLSKVYNDNEANRADFGGLYLYIQGTASGFCPPGWHLPSRDEWQQLIDACGGNAIAGGILKSIGVTYWDAPNTGAVDMISFGARGAGQYAVGETHGFFTEIYEKTYFMCSDILFFHDRQQVRCISMSNSDAIAKIDYLPVYSFISVRLVKNWSAPLSVMTDIDGNVYHYVTIGTQQWLVENLKTEHYVDGTAIPNLTLNADWLAEDGTPGHDGAICYYDNDEAIYKTPYGALYNWYAVNNAHGLAPAGWRVASKADYDALSTFLGGDAIAGGKLKEIGLAHWLTPNTGATDEYGFKGLPGGYRGTGGNFFYITEKGTLWSSTSINPASAWDIRLFYNFNVVNIDINVKYLGFSVRCIKDI